MSKVHMVNGVECVGFEAGVVKVPVSLLKTLAEKTEYADSGVRVWLRDWVHSQFEPRVEDFVNSLNEDDLVAEFNKYVETQKANRPVKEKSELDQQIADAKARVKALAADKKAVREAAKAAKESTVTA